MLLARAIINEVAAQPANPIIFRVLPTSEDLKMAFSNATFASVRLDGSEEKKFADWAKNLNTPLPELLNQFLGRGYKLSVTWVSKSNAFCVSVIGTPESRVNDNVIMTSWSDDLEEAFLIAAYKHFEVCGDDVWPTTNSSQRWG